MSTRQMRIGPGARENEVLAAVASKVAIVTPQLRDKRM
jgi:hypothetical protein